MVSPVNLQFRRSFIDPIRTLEVRVGATKRSGTWNSVGQQAFSRVSLALSSGKHSGSFLSGAYEDKLLSDSEMTNRSCPQTGGRSAD